MIDRVLPKDCCLCKACLNKCPANAIVFDREEQGFFYPRIDESVCVRCNACERVCPSLHPAGKNQGFSPRAYAAKSKDLDARLSSTSGGLFLALAEKVTQEKGFVCGAVFEDGFQVRHAVSSDKNQVRRMKGSKYAQSDMGLAYREIEKLLAAGTPVLFCGCPCQVAGLKNFVGRDDPSLYLVEIICHGVPSQRTLDTYRAYLEKRFRGKITDMRFRDKALGWHNSAVSVRFDNGKKLLEPITVNAYMKAFLSGITQKEACYSCKYKNDQSGADITLGDLWGAEALLPQMDDNKGLSAVILRSEKGARLFDSLTEIEKTEFPLENVIKYNRNVLEPTQRSKDRARFFEYAQANGFDNAWKDLMQETAIARCKRKLLFLLRCFVRKLQGRERPLY